MGNLCTNNKSFQVQDSIVDNGGEDPIVDNFAESTEGIIQLDSDDKITGGVSAQGLHKIMSSNFSSKFGIETPNDCYEYSGAPVRPTGLGSEFMTMNPNYVKSTDHALLNLNGTLSTIEGSYHINHGDDTLDGTLDGTLGGTLGDQQATNNSKPPYIFAKDNASPYVLAKDNPSPYVFTKDITN